MEGQDGLNLKNLLYRPYTDVSVGHHFTTPQDHQINTTLDMSKLVRMCRPALEQQKHIRARLRIQNTDRVTGTILGSEITKAYGEKAFRKTRLPYPSSALPVKASAPSFPTG